MTDLSYILNLILQFLNLLNFEIHKKLINFWYLKQMSNILKLI